MANKNYQGFTYLGLLFILTIMGITLALAGTLWSFNQKREKEAQLLFVGNQFQHAIGMYYEKTPGMIKRYPQTLEQLLEDNRYVSLRRYLRRVYNDPITGQSDWGVVTAPDGGIMGVYSKSNLNVIKTGNFKFENVGLQQKNKYSDWKFIYQPLENAVLKRKLE